MSAANISSNLPKAPHSVLKYDTELFYFLSRLVQSLEATLASLKSPSARGWQPTNIPASGNRAFDADAATLQETSRALARLIADFKASGFITS